MKDLRQVLTEKEAQLRQIGQEVAALRIVIKLCDDEKPLKEQILDSVEKAHDKAQAEVPPQKGWP